MQSDLAILDRLLDTALDIPADERERWVAGLPGKYDAVKPRLLGLLSRAAEIETSGFLESLPKLLDSADAGATGPGEPAGDRIGPYRLIRELGTGGMGTVWLAERDDDGPRRSVALKFLRTHGPRQALAERLARERDILAPLVHRGIARLYDAGISEHGMPYLALEYVEGRHIDEYCRQQDLGIDERLELFRQVAEAVAFAHTKLVVHRDLKPANVLVTDDGQAHLLDFGIAKILEDGRGIDSRLTEVAGRVLTPEYSSPEQIRGEPATTASDIYSLGVLLFELLTGTRPYRLTRDSRGALEEAILNDEPVRPSDAVGDRETRRRLRGDLDTIVLKALHKEADRRYATVNELIDDVDRFRSSRPVRARPSSAAYRAGKFVRRHKAGIATSGVALAAVLAATGISLWQGRVAIEERARAEEANELLSSIFTDADPYGAAGTSLTAVELLKQAHRRIADNANASAEQRLALLTVVGYTLNNFQEVEYAESVMSAAVAEATGRLPAAHPALLHARTVHAMTRRYAGDPVRTRADLEVLLTQLRDSRDAFPEDLPSALETGVVLALAEGRVDDAERYARESIAAATDVFGADHPETLAGQWQLVHALHQQRRADAALALAADVMPKTLTAYGGDERNPHVIEARELYGRVLARSGRIPEGIEMQARALAGAKDLFGPTAVAVCFFASNLARLRLQAWQLDAAAADVETALAACAETPGRDSLPYVVTRHLGASVMLADRDAEAALATLDEVAAAYIAVGEPPEGRLLDARAERALALAMAGEVAEGRTAIDAMFADMPTDTARYDLSSIRGTIEHLAGNYAAAARLQSAALEQMPEGATADYERARLLVHLAIAQIENGRGEDAATALDEALRLSERLGISPDPLLADAWTAKARVHLQRSEPALALPFAEKADAFWREAGASHRWAGESALWLGLTCSALGRSDEAASALGRARQLLAASALPSDARLLLLARTT